MSAVECVLLNGPVNGQVIYSKSPLNRTVAWNVTATFSCHKGFALKGDKTRTCGHSTNGGVHGVWSNGNTQSCVGQFWSKQEMSHLLFAVHVLILLLLFRQT